jgi:large subunit ribosomal protein L37
MVFPGKQHLAIKETVDAMVSSKNPVPAFASQDEVQSTVDCTLPDIFPLSPLIDLKMEHVYREENVTGKIINENFESEIKFKGLYHRR